MKKNLLIAAAMTAALASVGLGQRSHAADMFTINANTPGTMTFSGQGTAQFNNSLGSNNSFQVGSSTNLGVNASVSSTPEYGVTSKANMSLAGSSTLKQVIGTSGTDQQQSRTRTHERAHTVARESTREQGFGVDWNSSSNKGSYENEASWRVARDASYSSEYKNAYSAANSVSTEASANSSGTISGSFTTVESGRSAASGATGDWETAASSAVDVTHGSSYANRSSTYENSTEVEWQAARDSSYETEYAKAATNSNRFSDSKVSVQGIGSDANIVAADTSVFTVDIAATTNSGTAATSTAQGSSGANLSTSSFANQSNASTASGFIQAFGGSGAVSSGGTSGSAVQ